MPTYNFPTSLPSRVIYSILAFVKNLVSPKVYKDIQAVLSPCCVNSVSAVGFTCTATNVNTVTITLTDTMSFPGTVVPLLTKDGVVVNTTGTFNNNKTVVFPLVTSGATTNSWGVIFLFKTSTDGKTGYFRIATALSALGVVCT